ncbi:MAG: hypothetical protein ABI321_14490 [Polyangia bacterium]
MSSENTRSALRIAVDAQLLCADGRRGRFVAYIAGAAGAAVRVDGEGETFDVPLGSVSVVGTARALREHVPPAHRHVPSVREKASLDAMLAQPIAVQGRSITAGEYVRAIGAAGFETLVVGGAVRDAVQGVPARDVDLATSAWITHVDDAARDAALPALASEPPLGILFVGKPSDQLDLRVLRKRFNFGREQSLFGGSLLDDARHRDFAMNALYYDPVAELILDPLGCGVSDARTRTLTPTWLDDPIGWVDWNAGHVLRFLKFATIGYHHDEPLLEIARAHFATVVRGLPKFRLDHQLHGILRGHDGPTALAAAMRRLGYSEEDLSLLPSE